jgi:hypothetical protein
VGSHLQTHRPRSAWGDMTAPPVLSVTLPTHITLHHVEAASHLETVGQITIYTFLRYQPNSCTHGTLALCFPVNRVAVGLRYELSSPAQTRGVMGSNATRGMDVLCLCCPV